MSTKPSSKSFVGKDPQQVPMSLQRITRAQKLGGRHWIGPEDSVALSKEDQEAYTLAHHIMIRLCIEAPLLHKSGHPGGPLSAFTACYEAMRRANPTLDEPLRMSPGHLSLLGYALQWLFGRQGSDSRLQSPQAIMNSFRTVSGLPGHIEAGIGDIPFGTGPLGKALSNALGTAFAKKYLKKSGKVEVLLADGDSQEGQVMEAVRLASALQLDQLIVHGDWNDIQLSGVPSKTVACDFVSILHAAGWTVIEVQNGNDIAQVRAAQDLADSLVGKGHPIFICYYTTMGYGVPLMEEGSNTGKKNFHGSPLSKDEASEALESLQLPSLTTLTESYKPIQKKLSVQFEEAKKRRSSCVLPFALPSAYKRSITLAAGAARKDFGAVHVLSLMKHDERIVVLHADLADSGGFGVVEKAFPHRVINVGVAEANMYMMAAGMRQAGLLPVTYTFAAFGINEARANARLIDINTGHIPLGIVHDCTHAGLSVGEDGETHQERNYLNLPFDHTQVWVAGDSNQAGAMAEKSLEIAAQGSESVYVFSGRSNHPQILTSDGKPYYNEAYVFDGSASAVRGYGDARDEATIISYGVVLHEAIKAADLLLQQKRTVRVLNCACVRPLDASAILQAAVETQHLIIAEDHHTEGGLATQIADLIADTCAPCTLRRIGVRHYFPSGPAEDLYVIAGLIADDIAAVTEDQFAYRLAGGEEAFVAFVYALQERLSHTRFLPKSTRFLALLQDPSYIRSLRALWKTRSIDAEKLPSTEDLIDRLHIESDIHSFNPLTGISYGEKHDSGIV